MVYKKVCYRLFLPYLVLVNNCISAFSGTNVDVLITSEKDIGESDKITFYIDIIAPDLTITNIKVYDEDNNESDIFGQGETIRIKAFFKNIGNENATDASAMFYYDSIDEEHFIGSKSYESIDKYQKYFMLYRGILNNPVCI